MAHTLVSPEVTYDSATVTYDDLHVSYDGRSLPALTIKKKRHQRIEDYLGVGNALVHR